MLKKKKNQSRKEIQEILFFQAHSSQSLQNLSWTFAHLCSTHVSRPRPHAGSGNPLLHYCQVSTANRARKTELREFRLASKNTFFKNNKMHGLQSNNKIRAITQPHRLQITFSGIIPTEVTLANFMHFMITINQQEEINIFLIIPLVNPDQLYFQKPVEWSRSHFPET